MKSRITTILATLLALCAVVAFQNCSGSAFDELDVFGLTSKNNGNGYQGANPLARFAYNGSACESGRELETGLRWAGDSSWEVYLRNCEPLTEAEVLPDASIEVSDLNLHIVVADAKVYSVWTDVPMQAFCAVIKDDRTIDLSAPVFALTDLNGFPRANVLYKISDASVRAIYELPVQISGYDVSVAHTQVQVSIANARRGGSGTMSIKIAVPDTEPVEYIERTNVPVSCFANPGKLNP
ncbi:MAG: hypothetical protein KF767_00080 [Bdellovibrionaceae bacterium]|nr:hypothetical protein [Pseudobdellovibrionaceae bacterium]